MGEVNISKYLIYNLNGALRSSGIPTSSVDDAVDGDVSLKQTRIESFNLNVGSDGLTILSHNPDFSGTKKR